MRFWSRCLILFICCLSGCSGGTTGTESDARKYLDAEFQKWMAGKDNDVSTMKSRMQGHQDPISYEIRSVVADEPDILAYDETRDLPKDASDWPAFRFNVAIEKKSQAGTPLTKITTYTLTWNPHERKWYTQERF